MAENETSSKDDIAAAFDAATPTPEPVEAPPDVVVATEPIGETSEAKEARLRDEKGRFAAKIGESQKEPTPKVV